MEIDRHVEPAGAETPCQPEVVAKPGHAAAAGGHDHFVQMRIGRNHGRGCRLDDVRNVGVWKTIAQAANGRRRENNIANLPQANEQNAH
jgi:hypothetical protein